MIKRSFPDEGAVSFHMPGHKRRLIFGGSSLLRYDVTELPGMDNLIEPEGWIRELCSELSRFYGSLGTRILVGGSSAGILSAVLGAAEYVRLRKSKVRAIINRNAHISVFNAVELAGIIPHFVSPEYEDTLPAGFEPELLLSEAGFADLLILTYPFYQGGIYDIAKIIAEARRINPDIIIIADEAHGAHFVLDEKLRGKPLSSLSLGADVVVQSIHKTLPALGGTALLHYGNTALGAALHGCGNQLRSIEWHLRALQTTSPSFLMLESIAQMLEILKKRGVELYGKLLANIDRFYERTRLTPVRYSSAQQDASKILIRTKMADSMDFFVRRNIYPEMEVGGYMLFLSSIANISEDFDILAAAVENIESRADEIGCDRKGTVADGGGVPHGTSAIKKSAVLRYGCSANGAPGLHDGGWRGVEKGADTGAGYIQSGVGSGTDIGAEKRSEIGEERCAGDVRRGTGRDIKNGVESAEEKAGEHINNAARADAGELIKVTCAEAEELIKTVSDDGGELIKAYSISFGELIGANSDDFGELIDAACAVGRISLETLVLYPPGSPLIVRGEVFSSDVCKALAGEKVLVSFKR